MKFDHAEAFVWDREAAVPWYGRVLGLKEVRRWDPPGPIMVGGPDGMIALFQAHRNGPDNSDDDRQPPIRWRRIAWRVEPHEFERAQQHLEACGVPFEGPSDHGGPMSIYFSDPDGNPLEITCYPER